MDRLNTPVTDDTHGLHERNANLWERVIELEAQLDALRKTSSLREYDTTFFALRDQCQAMVTRYDMEGNFLFISASRQMITGYTNEELCGRSAFEYMHPEDMALIQETVLPKVMNGEAVRFEWRAKLKSGGYRWMESTTKLIYNEQQEPFEVHCTSIDIQDRKDIEQSLRQSEARWRAMVEASPDWVRVVDKNLRLIYANRVMGGQTWSPGEHLDYRAWIPDGFREVVAKAVSDTLITQSTIVIDGIEHTFDGQRICLRLRLSPILRDGEEHVLVIVTDVTAIRQQEEAIAASEQKYRLLFERCPEPAWVIDKTTMRFLAVNPAAVAHYGFSEGEMLEMTALDIRMPEDQESFQRRFAAMEHQSEGRNRYVRHIKKDGTILYADALWHEIEFQGKQAYLVFCRDVTEQKRAEDAIQALNTELDRRVIERTAQLEAINHELESFTYSVSHDLRSPLRSVDGYSTMLLNDYGYLLDAEAKEYLERIRISGRRMSDLINNLLSLSRLTRTPLKPERLSLTYISQAILEELRSNDVEQQGDVYVLPDMWVVADPQLMQIAMTNLIENAIKFTSRRSHPMIEIGFVEAEGNRHYYVKDNGAGFDMAYADKLFGPFQRLHSDREFDGTGIGLATVQRIMQRHNGRIWAEAAVDKGATFWFSIPDQF